MIARKWSMSDVIMPFHELVRPNLLLITASILFYQKSIFEDKPILYRIRNVIVTILCSITIYHTTLSIVAIFMNIDDLTTVIFICMTLLYAFQALFRLFFVVIKRKRIASLIEMCSNLPDTCPEFIASMREAFTKIEKQSRTLLLVVFVFSEFVGIGYISLPILRAAMLSNVTSHNEELPFKTGIAGARPLITTCWYPYDVFVSPVYETEYLMEALGTLWVTAVVSTCDSLLCSFVIYVIEIMNHLSRTLSLITVDHLPTIRVEEISDKAFPVTNRGSQIDLMELVCMEGNVGDLTEQKSFGAETEAQYKPERRQNCFGQSRRVYLNDQRKVFTAWVRQHQTVTRYVLYSLC